MSDDSAPVTRAELAAELTAAEQRIIERTQEFIRDAQTEILRGFERFARSQNARIAALYGTTITHDERLTAIEERLTELEKRLIRGPAN
jgi:hypothetical protein